MCSSWQIWVIYKHNLCLHVHGQNNPSPTEMNRIWIKIYFLMKGADSATLICFPNVSSSLLSSSKLWELAQLEWEHSLSNTFLDKNSKQILADRVPFHMQSLDDYSLQISWLGLWLVLHECFCFLYYYNFIVTLGLYHPLCIHFWFYA